LGHSSATAPTITRVILYVRDIPAVATFYERFFNMRPLPGASEDWVELAGARGATNIALHKASVKQRSSAAVKLVFGVADVRAFKLNAEAKGLKFGVIHAVEGFEFSNAKDPAGNSISISSRGLKSRS
jgi:predicted enzyme related to lactoylglutathione lyase